MSLIGLIQTIKKEQPIKVNQGAKGLRYATERKQNMQQKTLRDPVLPTNKIAGRLADCGQNEF